jgi:hypothetical protein
MDIQQPRVIRLTREQLHDLVWKQSVSQLAREFGTSDVSLAKWCKQLNVPRPGRGHWAKIQAGRTIASKELPPPIAGMPTELTLERHEARPMAPDESIVSAPVFEQVQVPTTLDDIHPLVAKTRKVLLRAEVRDGWLLNDAPECAPIYVSKAMLDRALRVLEGLLRAVTRAGWTLDCPNKGRPAISVEGVRVPFSIEETRTFGATMLELVPKGLLRITLPWSPGHGGGRRTFQDAKVQRVENILDEVCLGLWDYAQNSRAWDARCEAEARQREERARAAEIEKQRQLLNETRQQHLDWRLNHLERARKIRDLLGAISRTPAQASQNSVWLEWLRLQADACERAAVADPCDECRFVESPTEPA